MLLLKQQHDDIGYLRSLHVHLTSQVFLRRITRAGLLVESVHIEQDTSASLRYGRVIRPSSSHRGPRAY